MSVVVPKLEGILIMLLKLAKPSLKPLDELEEMKSPEEFYMADFKHVLMFCMRLGENKWKCLHGHIKI